MRRRPKGFARPARRAVVLDPLADLSRADLGAVLYAARQYGEAASGYAEVLSLNPGYAAGYGKRGLALLALGDLADPQSD